MKKASSIIKFHFVALGLLALVSCSSGPKVSELSINSDPQQEIDRVEAHIKESKLKQIDLLSPNNYDAAVSNLDDAKKKRTSDADQKAVLHKIALAQAYIEQADRVGGVGQQLLNATVAARQDALQAKSDVNFKPEFAKIDAKLRGVGEQIEVNDTSFANKYNSTFETEYRRLELLSIKKQALGNAQYNIEQAVREGAKKQAPDTLAWAKKHFEADVAMIDAHPHRQSDIDKASADAVYTSERLLKIVRSAKGASVKSHEDLAKDAESSADAKAASTSKFNESQSELSQSEHLLADSNQRNENLTSQMWLDKEYDMARGEFTNEEADVYKQGDKLLLRLKGISFANNKSGITKDNFALLAKVQKVIGSVGSSHIFIEGHTDSIGDRKLNEGLSAKRAEAVETYLVANNTVTSDRITAAGFGDTRPISSNKTAEGRAQNRRVDVIITSDTVTTQ